MPDDPTTNAASNMKVPQYMACSVVPLVSKVGDLAASVDFGGAGYVCDPDNPEALKKALLFALEDGKRTEKAARAREFASAQFNWRKLASDFSGWLRATIQ